MKQKYGDQDEEERQKKMELIGAKDVQGFSLAKHQEYKLGKLINNEQIDEEKDGEDKDQEVDQDNENNEQEKKVDDVPDEFIGSKSD